MSTALWSEQGALSGLRLFLALLTLAPENPTGNIEVVIPGRAAEPSRVPESIATIRELVFRSGRTCSWIPGSGGARTQ